MKKAVILLGSPRKNGNTNSLVLPFREELEQQKFECVTYDLYRMNIKPCEACRACQKDWSIFGCKHDDDMQQIFDNIMDSQLIVVSSPVYSWYCTPPVKAALDRLVYGMNKYYGEQKGPSLWKGKHLALITTCGYPPEKGADLIEEGMKRYCKHSQLIYSGMLVHRHMGYGTEFMDENKRTDAFLFAKKIREQIEQEQ